MKYIKGFDTLRGVSIILVLLAHLGLYHHLPENYFIRIRVWSLMSGGTGVLIFFTLSGFLITKILLRELEEFKNIGFINFYARRFIRLLPPLLLFYAAIGILMQLELIQSTSTGFLFSLFYIYNFVPNQFYTAELGHTWSLAVEEQYYLIWPFIIAFFSRMRVFVFILLILVVCILSVYLLPEFPFASHYKTSRWLIPAVAPIIIGSFSAILIDQNEKIWLSYFKNSRTLLMVGIMLFLSPLFTPILKLSFMFQSMGVSVILVWVLFNQESRVTSVLNNRLLTYIGTISYGIYVYQGLFLRTGPSDDLWIQQFPQNIVLTVLTAMLSYHYFERPLLKLKGKFKRIPTDER